MQRETTKTTNLDSVTLFKCSGHVLKDFLDGIFYLFGRKMGLLTTQSFDQLRLRHDHPAFSMFLNSITVEGENCPLTSH